MTRTGWSRKKWNAANSVLANAAPLYGVWLLACGRCGLELGRLVGVTGASGMTTCSRCGWWIKYEWVWDDGKVVIDFLEDRDHGRWPR